MHLWELRLQSLHWLCDRDSIYWPRQSSLWTAYGCLYQCRYRCRSYNLGAILQGASVHYKLIFCFLVLHIPFFADHLPIQSPCSLSPALLSDSVSVSPMPMPLCASANSLIPKNGRSSPRHIKHRGTLVMSSPLGLRLVPSAFPPNGRGESFICCKLRQPFCHNLFFYPGLPTNQILNHLFRN
jgi:hypothetical protein